VKPFMHRVDDVFSLYSCCSTVDLLSLRNNHGKQRSAMSYHREIFSFSAILNLSGGSFSALITILFVCSFCENQKDVKQNMKN